MSVSEAVGIFVWNEEWRKNGVKYHKAPGRERVVEKHLSELVNFPDLFPDIIILK